MMVACFYKRVRRGDRGRASSNIGVFAGTSPIDPILILLLSRKPRAPPSGIFVAPPAAPNGEPNATRRKPDNDEDAYKNDLASRHARWSWWQ